MSTAMATPAHSAHAHDAHDAHAGTHHGDDVHGHGHGHHGPDDVAGDKKAAFVGLVGGMALIGALMYGMVMWTNAQFAGHAAEATGSGATTTAPAH